MNVSVINGADLKLIQIFIYTQSFWDFVNSGGLGGLGLSAISAVLSLLAYFFLLRGPDRLCLLVSNKTY